MMNRFICIPLCLFLLSVCNPKKNERPNGWYYITDRVEDSISLEPIVTINDFEEIKLDSAENLKGKFIYQITGHVAADCVEKWADATEHSIGKRIGFVFQDEVICTPCINCYICPRYRYKIYILANCSKNSQPIRRNPIGCASIINYTD